ncbi:MAG: YkgJ family cysteine cluster protein [Candidatus Thorarchaeota archaeon]|nr:YkgJ family cysteine cluster protein [Candidatus Thorarchaeota archaeon]
MSEKSKYTFKCLEQQCTTIACHIRPTIDVSLGDLTRWTTQGYLMNIIPGVSLHLPKSEHELLNLEMSRKPLLKDSEQTACFFFDEEANGCEIRYSRPLSCRAYPLEYNGEKFYLSSKDCPGVGQGEVTKEALQEVRDLAEQAYKERGETYTALPALYSIIMTQMIKQSTEAMQSLSEEDRKKMDEIMSKPSPSEIEEEPTTSEDGED